MHAFLEPLVFVIRCGPAAVKHGDPWELAVLVTVDLDGGLSLRALSTEDRFTKEHWRAMEKACRQLGYTKGKWIRADGRIIEVF